VDKLVDMKHPHQEIVTETRTMSCSKDSAYIFLFFNCFNSSSMQLQQLSAFTWSIWSNIVSGIN